MRRCWTVALLFALLVAPFAAADEPKAPQDRKETAKAADAKAQAPVAARVVTPRNLDDALRILQSRRVTVEFDGMAMDEAVSFIGRVGRINAMVSPVFQAKAAGALPPVTLKLRDVSLRQVAEYVAKATGSKMALRDGILQFTTPEDARGAPVLRIFSIADLTFRIRNFPGPDLNLHVGGAEYVQEEESDQPSPFDDPQTVVEMVKKFTGAGTWDDEAVSISADERRLVVKQYPEVQREISRLLLMLRAVK